ncbi:glycosyltransferase family 4 protein [Streptomyces sp. NBC_00094]|uniref:glycosyltransferase family 4 protein n=1 Tax=Streptomyces sp. NBC_00094 TaxID=2903620 RepID=UPI00225160FD|nr:glycosyltransferase [Streptomyces sp. NBC_00094]MCX5388918.1 glycosyltransferase [Streptomyces sp. NBC_00094]
MTTSRSVLLVAVSGPDGAGKSSLVRRLATLLGERGIPVVTTHCYGCFLCRRFPVPPRVGEEGEHGERWARRAADPERRGSLPRRAHAFLDATELAVRIAAARLAATARARGRQAVVVTDRGPLDGLVKFDLPVSSAAAGTFRRIAGRYGLTVLVETGPDTLLGRGWEEGAGSPAAWWARYRAWSVRLPRVARVDGERAPSLVAATTLDQILDVVRERTASDGMGEEAGGGPERGTDARPHVVVSIYDDADNPDYRGGGALVVGKVARRLADDFRVTVVTAGRRAGTEYRDGIRYVRLPVCRAGPRAGQLVFLTLLPFVARRIPHDLWLESFTPPFSTSFLPLATRAPVVGIDQGRSAEALWRRYHLPFFLVERLGLRCYRHIVAMNAADGSVIRRLSPRADVQVIANGVEPRLLDESRLGNGQFILFLGRIDTWVKGLDLLLDAYDRARPPLELLLAGSGTPAEERRLAALVAARTRGREPRIHWVGYAEEERKRQLLRDSAFLVVPSRHETFGLVALEGMSYGKPVLHFDLPALRWMRDGGDVAVPPFDVAALGERMDELARDEALRRGLGRRSALAAKHYTWDEMTGRYLALAHRLLDTPAPARRPRKRGTSWQTTR